MASTGDASAWAQAAAALRRRIRQTVPRQPLLETLRKRRLVGRARRTAAIPPSSTDLTRHEFLGGACLVVGGASPDIKRGMSLGFTISVGLIVLTMLGADPLRAATTPPVIRQQATDDEGDRQASVGEDILVTGRRVAGSAIGDAEPVAILDAAALRSLGATDLRMVLDRLKPLTEAAGGGSPVILLNGRRVSSFGELRSLPPPRRSTEPRCCPSRRRRASASPQRYGC